MKRAIISPSADGGGLRIYNGEGELRSKSGTLNDGGMGLLLMDESTNPTVQLKSTADGAQLVLSGRTG